MNCTGWGICVSCSDNPLAKDRICIKTIDISLKSKEVLFRYFIFQQWTTDILTLQFLSNTCIVKIFFLRFGSWFYHLRKINPMQTKGYPNQTEHIRIVRHWLPFVMFHSFFLWTFSRRPKHEQIKNVAYFCVSNHMPAKRRWQNFVCDSAKSNHTARIWDCFWEDFRLDPLHFDRELFTGRVKYWSQLTN